MDLTSIICFKVEPLPCYNGYAFVHIQRYRRKVAFCVVCSEKHHTSE